MTDWEQPPGDDLGSIEQALPKPPEGYFWQLHLSPTEDNKEWGLWLELRRKRPDPGPWWSKLRSPSVVESSQGVRAPASPIAMTEYLANTAAVTQDTYRVAKQLLLELEAKLHLLARATRTKEWRASEGRR